MNIIEAIAAEPWAITRDALDVILSIANRETDIEALETRIGRPLKNTRNVTVRDGAAIIPIVGPIFHRANLFTRISGATSNDILALDINAALDDPQVQQIILSIDSPGGQVAGTSELADMIFAARDRKPITAYIEARGASGAYWIASAADEIVINSTAMAGSIGVVMVTHAGKDKDEIEIVSSNAPNKRVDASTDAGRAELQRIVNRLEVEFVETISRNRSVSIDKVLADFGQGGILIGSDAVVAGMADRVGSFESILADDSGVNSRSIFMSNSNSTDSPAITIEQLRANHPDIVQALQAEGEARANADREQVVAQARVDGAVDERTRIQAVHEQGQQLPGHEELIATLMFDGKTSGPEAAVQMLAAEKQARGTALTNHRKDAPKPAPTVTTDPDDASVDDNTPLEDCCKANWDRDAKIRQEFGTLNQYVAYQRAVENGRVKVLKQAS